jgi:predicted peptidase
VGDDVLAILYTACPQGVFMHLPKSLLLLATLLACTALPACDNGASEAARFSISKKGITGFKYAKITRANRTRKYALFIPLHYDPKQKYPVLIFLHGIGEGCAMGEGDGKQLTVGLGPAVQHQRQTFPFICIFPQSDGNWDASSEYAQDVIAALNDVSKKYAVDRDRVFLTGVSTGGYGTYVIGSRYHKLFAALVPMASNQAASAAVDKLTSVPVRAYCSQSGDPFAGINDRAMVTRINALGGHAEFFETPTEGHNCWDYVYSDPSLYRWLKNQSREFPATPQW